MHKLAHEVVDYEQYGFSTVKVLHIRKSLMENDFGIVTEQLLIFTIAVDDLSRSWVYHPIDIVY